LIFTSCSRYPPILILLFIFVSFSLHILLLFVAVISIDFRTL
jgi:hypothetical protein